MEEKKRPWAPWALEGKDVLSYDISACEGGKNLVEMKMMRKKKLMVLSMLKLPEYRFSDLPETIVNQIP
ncbi:hypothetical protein CRG98_028120 [Punica granatum]|uniref:Uncharacterized protein n=1 Tax=Punica granatum TaxID=22663 RepID=A0A2I0J6M8_PUNGR|nr:hypothetical protein CRG98_028120 [Punica granatum]